jgi:hypothetical protein
MHHKHKQHCQCAHVTSISGVLTALAIHYQNIISKCVKLIDIESLQNRLLKVCYMPTTSPGLPRLLFGAAINSTNEANNASGMCC